MVFGIFWHSQYIWRLGVSNTSLDIYSCKHRRLLPHIQARWIDTDTLLDLGEHSVLFKLQCFPVKSLDFSSFFFERTRHQLINLMNLRIIKRPQWLITVNQKVMRIEY